LLQTVAHLKQVANSHPTKPAAPKEEGADEAAQPGPNEALVAELPEGALEDFTRRVQPILANNCTTSGCHRVDGPQQFQLNRDLLHGMANRRSTMRNLVATLNLVNKETPLESELLAQASAAHGGMEAPPLPLHQRELHQRLEEWVLLVSGQKPAEPELPDASVVLAGRGGSRKGGVVQVSGIEAPTLDDNVTTANFDDVAMPDSAAKRMRVGVQLKKWSPRDEFDPEIFNRLQGNQSASTSAEPVVDK
jgi:hypothetical protein